MSDKTLAVSGKPGYTGTGGAARQLLLAMAVPFVGMIENVVKVPSGTLADVTFTPDFGYVVAPSYLYVRNRTSQALRLQFQDQTDTALELPPLAFVLVAMPSAPVPGSDREINSVRLITTEEVTADGETIEFRIVGDPDGE